MSESLLVIFVLCVQGVLDRLAVAALLLLQVYGRGGFPVPVTEVPLMLLNINYALAT